MGGKNPTDAYNKLPKFGKFNRQAATRVATPRLQNAAEGIVDNTAKSLEVRTRRWHDESSCTERYTFFDS